MNIEWDWMGENKAKKERGGEEEVRGGQSNS